MKKINGERGWLWVQLFREWWWYQALMVWLGNKYYGKLEVREQIHLLLLDYRV